MKRFASWIFPVIISIILLFPAVMAAGEVPHGEYLLPNTTKGFIAITNVDSLIEHFNKTQLGKLTADPVMEPFTKDVRRQFENRWSGVHERLGLTLDDLKDVPGGEVCVALIEPVENDSALAIVVDVTDRLPKANALLEKISKNLVEQGAERKTLKIKETNEPLIQFELPIPAEEQEADQSKLSGTHKSTGASSSVKYVPKPRMAYYFLIGNVLGASDDIDVIRGIIGRLTEKKADKKGATLAELEGFRKVMDRCKNDISDISPQVRWFIHPLGYAAAARAGTPANQRRKGKSVLEVMRNQGLGAIQGVGGYASFSSEGYDLVHRTAVYAPPPYVNAMKMIVFLNGKDYSPQKWVPREISTYSTLYFDILNAFDNFGPLFNELFGDGESSAWTEVLDGLKSDPNGPQLDLREELIKNLGQRVSMVTDYELPITTGSERVLFAIESTNDKAVATALQKWMENDATAKKREIDEHVIWEIVENEEQEIAGPEVSFGEVPDLAPVAKPKKNKQDRWMPHAAATVVDGHLFVASHMDFLLKVLRSKDSLAQDVDYQLVTETINQMNPQDKCGRFFSRTDEEYRPTYELIRQNKMPESESLLGQLLNKLFGEGKKGVVRHQKIDGSKLPEYEVVRHYLGPAGMQVTSEKDGWFLKGFTVNMETLKGEQTVQSPQSQATPSATDFNPEKEKLESPQVPAEAQAPTDTPSSSDQVDPKTETEPKAKIELQVKQVGESTVK